MIFHSIEDILAANVAANDRLAATVSKLNQAQVDFRPAEQQWTIAEIAEHVSIVSHGVLRITHKLLKQGEADPRPAKTDLNLGPTILDENGNQLPKFEAPENVRPKGEVKAADALSSLSRTIDGFAEIRQRLEAVDLSEQKFPHPILGPLSAYQWMVLLGEHTDRHRMQIEAVINLAGFPG